MQDTTRLILERLRAQLASDNEEWGVSGIEIAGAGLQFLVFWSRAQMR